MKKALLYCVLVFALVLGLQTMVLANDPGTDGTTTTKEVVVNSLNVRSGPGQDSPVIGHLPKGAKVAELYNNGTWSTIQYGGGVAFVYTPYVKATTQPTATPEATMYVTAQLINVRSGKGIGFPVIGHLAYGDQAQVMLVDSDTNWYEIHYYDGVGFVAANNLSSTNPANQPLVQQPTQAGGEVYTVSCPSTLNVRSGPGTGYTVLGHLYNGDVVNVTGFTGDWAQIYFNENLAYVSRTYLRK